MKTLNSETSTSKMSKFMLFAAKYSAYSAGVIGLLGLAVLAAGALLLGLPSLKGSAGENALAVFLTLTTVWTVVSGSVIFWWLADYYYDHTGRWM